MLNIYGSRRGCFLKCTYWHRLNANMNKITYADNPNGTFYAKYITDGTNQANNVSNEFQANDSAITIQTEDNVSLLVNDKVVINSDRYIILSVSETIKTKTSEFSTKPSKITTVRMRKA